MQVAFQDVCTVYSILLHTTIFLSTQFRLSQLHADTREINIYLPITILYVCMHVCVVKEQ